MPSQRTWVILMPPAFGIAARTLATRIGQAPLHALPGCIARAAVLAWHALTCHQVSAHEQPDALVDRRALSDVRQSGRAMHAQTNLHKSLVPIARPIGNSCSPLRCRSAAAAHPKPATRVDGRVRFVATCPIQEGAAQAACRFFAERIALDKPTIHPSMHDFIAQANVDHFLNMLTDDQLGSERRDVVMKLLMAELDKLSHGEEQLDFAESRAAKVRIQLNRLRVQFCNPDLDADSQLRVGAMLRAMEQVQPLLDDLCIRVRRRAQSSR